jgi:hypothetical protein
MWGGERGVCGLVGKPEGMKRCEDNIKMYLKEIGWESANCIILTGDRDKWRAAVDAVMNILVS